MDEAVVKKLVNEAWKAKELAYAPYSKFLVGCALLTHDGNIITGCNVENASYPVVQCAEASAIGRAVSMGYRKFKACAVSV